MTKRLLGTIVPHARALSRKYFSSLPPSSISRYKRSQCLLRSLRNPRPFTVSSSSSFRRLATGNEKGRVPPLGSRRPLCFILCHRDSALRWIVNLVCYGRFSMSLLFIIGTEMLSSLRWIFISMFVYFRSPLLLYIYTSSRYLLYVKNK